MKTKSYLTLSLALLGLFALNAQSSLSQGISSNGTQVDMQTFQNAELTTKSLTEPIDVDGNPFLFPTYVPAKVYFIGTDQEPQTFILNYNIYADLMKMSDSDEETGEVKILPKASNYEVAMGGKRFRYLSFEVDAEILNKYVEIVDVYDNGDILAVVRTQTIQQAENSGSTYSTPKKAKLKSTEDFYFINTDGFAFEMENHKKKILKGMTSSTEDKVKDYIKDNDIRFDDDLRGLKGVARYYSSIR